MTLPNDMTWVSPKFSGNTEEGHITPSWEAEKMPLPFIFYTVLLSYFSLFKVRQQRPTSNLWGPRMICWDKSSIVLPTDSSLFCYLFWVAFTQLTETLLKM